MSLEPQDFQNILLSGNQNTNSQDDEIAQEPLIDLRQNVGNPQIISQNEKEAVVCRTTKTASENPIR